MLEGALHLRRHTVRIFSSGIALVLLLGGCASPGPRGNGATVSPEEVPSLAGSYQGMLNMEGQPFQAGGHVMQEGSLLTVVLSLGSGLDARGEGRVEGRKVRMELDYGSGCPGTLVLRGTLTEEGRRLTGQVEARDCTGEATGSFHLDRPGAR